jgi:hypothetical protein
MTRATRTSENEPPAPSPEPELETVVGNGLDEDTAKVPPPDAAKAPSKFARFRVDETVASTAGEAAVVEVKKPETGVFFQTHNDPEMYCPIHCFEQKAGGKRYYPIDPSLIGLPEIEGMTKRVLFVPYITQFGGLGIWPISIDYDDMAWIKSALFICEEAKTRWVAAISVKKQQAYRIQYAAKGFGEPPWPPLDQDKLLELAFRVEEWILARDHPVLQRIRGE